MNTLVSSSPRSRSEWTWLWQQVRPSMQFQIGALLCNLTASAFGLTSPLLIRWLIDDVLPRRRWGALALVAVLIFALHVGRTVMVALGGLVNMLGVQRLGFRVRIGLLRRLQSLPASFFAKHPLGDLVQRLEQDVANVAAMGSDVWPSVVRLTIDLLMTLTVMIFLDWRVSIVVLPLIPLFAYVRHRFHVLLRKRAEEVREAMGRQSGLLNEMLAGATQIQLLAAEERFARQYVRLALKTRLRQMSQKKTELLFTLCTMSAVGFGTAAIIGYGGTRVLTGTLTAGGLVAFYAYVGNIFSPMSTAVELYARLNRVRASIRRLMEIEDTPNAIVDAPDAVPVPASPEVVVCTNVSFDYTPEKRTLRQVDFDARAGERVVLVGASGCGKTSLLKLIPRLYDAGGGRIEIDGRDVRALRLNSLRRAISFVPQDPALFNATLRDNLKYGAPTATPHDMAQAAWITCLTDVVARLPAGWDTKLGPMGVGLSGGERQRVAIARALLQRRPILILDEATSALDAPTEHRLLTRLEQWCAGRIVICVSHRLSAAHWASRVVVFRDGEVVEDGTHASLYREGTHYYSLWQRPAAPRTASDHDADLRAPGAAPPRAAASLNGPLTGPLNEAEDSLSSEPGLPL